MEMHVRNHQLQNPATPTHRSPLGYPPRDLSRRGFTLLELMVAIVVIAILAAFLLPAIQGVVGTAKDAAVRNEISQMESAIATFKAKFGIEPPSGIVLCEAAANWGSNASSKALIQRMWPNYDFATDNNINGDASSPGPDITLNGSECLVFFLGGMLKNGALSGFSKNPSNPFETTTTSRDGPFFEFVPSRLRGTGSSPRTYIDPLGGQSSPYIYLSSYDGTGYKTADIPAGTNLSGPYLTATGGAAHKAKSFQIISPGADTLYSTSGGSVVYDPSLANSGLSTNNAAYDNITNFAPGRLKP